MISLLGSTYLRLIIILIYYYFFDSNHTSPNRVPSGLQLFLAKLRVILAFSLKVFSPGTEFSSSGQHVGAVISGAITP